MITTLIRAVIGFKVLFWVIVIILAFVYSSEIGSLFSGAADRFDHMIGYTETRS